MRRSVLALSLPGALVVLALWAQAAAACTYGPVGHLANSLALTESAFVGVVESVSPDEPGKPFTDATLVIRVERVVKGTPGERVTVRSQVGYCGGIGGPGSRSGYLLYRGASGALSAFSAEPSQLDSAARLPAPSGTARFVAAVDGPTLDAVALGGDGTAAAYSPRAGTPLALAGCGATSVLAARHVTLGIVVIRKDTSMARGRELELPVSELSALTCSEDRVWAAGIRNERPVILSVGRTRREIAVIHRAPRGAVVAFSGPRAYVASRGRVAIVTLATGTVRTVRHRGSFEQLSVLGGRVAGRLADGRAGRLDLTTGRLRTGARVDGLVWLSRTTLLDATNGVVRDSRLKVERRLIGELGQVVGVRDGTAYLASGRVVRRLEPGAKRVKRFAALPGKVVALTTISP